MSARSDESRRHFLANLAGRLEELEGVLARLEAAPESSILKEGLLRRVQAMHSASALLGFADASELFEQCSRALQGATDSVTRSTLQQVRGWIRDVPEVVPGLEGALTVSAEEAARDSESERPSLVAGLSRATLLGVQPSVPDLLVTGIVDGPESERLDAGLARPTLLGVQPSQSVPDLLALTSEPGVRDTIVGACEAAPSGKRRHAQIAATKEQALHLARVRSPEIVVVDWSHPESLAFVAALHGDPKIESTAVLLLVEHGDEELPAMLSDFAASRALRKPVSRTTLVRALVSLGTAPSDDAWDGITIAELSDRLCEELRQGLERAVPAGSRDRQFDLGAAADVKAALWTALAKVRQSVSQHAGGAVLFVDDDPTRGVPMLLERDAEGARGGVGGDAPMSLAGRRVLVVDDDPAIAWFLSGALRKAGAEVIEAHHGARALELAYQNWPDIVFCDVLMPDLDGPSLCHEIKSDLLLSDTPVVLVSWKEDLLERVRELGSSADAYLRKEASAPNVVRTALELLRARERLERRIAASAEVQGRLEGTTPRSILELVCRLRPNAHVTFGDATREFVARVVDGELWAVERRGASGEELTGDLALRELLGLRLGRFATETAKNPGERQFVGALPPLLAPAAARARSLTRLFAPLELARVAQIAVGTAGGGGPLPSASAHALAGLVSGLAPAAVAEIHGADTLSRLLVDLTRRGAISAVFSPDGDDLLATEIARRNARQEALQAVPDFDTPRPGDRLEVDPSRSELPPRVQPTLGANAVDAPLGAPTSSEVRHGAPLFQLDWEGRDAESAPAPAVDSLELGGRASAEAPPSAAAPSVPAAAQALDLGDALANQLFGSPEPIRTVAPESRTSASVSALLAQEPSVPRRKLARQEVLHEPVGKTAESRPLAAAARRPSLHSAMPQRSPTRESRWTESTEAESVARSSQRDLREILSSVRAGTERAIRGAALSGKQHVQALTSGGKATWQRAAAGTKPTARLARGAASAVGVTIIAGGLAFGAVRLGASLFSSGMADATTASANDETAQPPSAVEVPAQDSSAAASAGTPTGASSEPAASKGVAVPSAFAVSELEVPAGVELAAGKGLLEISTGGSHKIYVGGVFVGAGPVRRIPVPEGEHAISVRLDGDERSQAVNVAAGRRTRVTIVTLEGTQPVANK